jgi:glycosyltransferase involved in cell wall biosynthesis
MTSKPRVLVVGQTPPPFHGQAIMIQMLVDGPLRDVELHHVRMGFSSDMNAVGKFALGKLGHLVHVIVAIAWSRFRHGCKVLYYPPAGPNRVPMYRDVVLLLATRWLFSKTIFHFQASGLSELLARQPAAIGWLARRAYLRPDVAIQMSDLMVPDGEYLRAKKIAIVPNAASDHTQRYADEIRLRSERTGPYRLLYLGTVCETKGILVALEACSRLKSQGIRLHLDVVGSFQPHSFEQDVRAYIQTQSLEQTVTLHGQKTGEDKWLLFSQADVFCFPSYYESEGFPCVLVEAMSFGLPVVSTQWRGIPSIVNDGVTGFLVPIKDSAATADKILQLAQDRDLRRAMQTSAREAYLQHFTDVRHLESMSQIFHEVTGT